MTSTIMREPEVYDVWLMRVEFPDHPGVGKVRPVIVTRVEEDRVSGIVVKVTSVTTWNGPGDVPLLDWRQEGLYKPSVARCSQRFWFGNGDLLKYFGRLSLRDANDLDAGLDATATSRPTASRIHDDGGANGFSPWILSACRCLCSMNEMDCWLSAYSAQRVFRRCRHGVMPRNARMVGDFGDWRRCQAPAGTVECSRIIFGCL